MESIDNVFEKLESKSNTLAALIQTPIYTYLAVYGKTLQTLNKSGQRPYDWWTGHLSDIFAPAAEIALLYLITNHFNENKHERSTALKIFTIGLASYNTLIEFCNIDSKEHVFDNQDIVCFWTGAGIAYFGTKILSEKINDFLKNKYVDKLAKGDALK